MPRKFSVEKMRRNLGRSAPDVVWKNFDPLDLYVEAKIAAWRAWYQRQMEFKHGKKLRGLMIFQSDRFDSHMIRVQMIAKLKEK